MSKGETYLIRRAAGEKSGGELIRVPDELILLASAPNRQAAEDVAVAATGRDLAFILFRHLKKSLAFFVLVFGLAAAAATLIPDSFQSDARLLVRLGVESMLPDPSVQIGKAVVAPIQNRNAEINTELQILRSREVAEAVLARIGPGRVFGAPVAPVEKVNVHDADVRAAIMQLDRKLSVEVEPDSNVLAVRYEAKDPQVAQDVVAAYVDCFREIRARIHRNPMTARFFGDQQASVRAEIESLEQEIRRLKDATGVADLEEQRRVLSARAANLQTEIDRVNQLLVGSNAGSAHPGRARLAALEQQQRDVDAQVRKINAVAVRLGELERDFGVKTETFKQYAAIAQQAGVDTAMADGRLSNISVVQAASLPIKPSKPNRLLLIGVGLFLAVSGGIGLAFVSEALDHSVRRPEDVAAMGVSRCISIPYISALAEEGTRRARLKPVEVERVIASATGAPAARGANGVSPGRAGTFSAGPWNVVDRTADVQSPLAERVDDNSTPVGAQGGSPVVWFHDLRQATRQLAEKLLVGTAVDGTSPRVIAVVGGRKGQGTSTVACATATLLSERVLLDAPAADADAAVLMIDADLHSPSLHRQFGVEGSPGLTDWIADPTNAQTPLEQTLHPTPVEGLTVMPAGALRGGGLTPSRLKRLIDVVAANYRYVLIDLPPLEESPEAARLAAVCDGAVIVMESESVRKREALHLLGTLAESGAHVLGAVLNKRVYPVPEWIYRRI